LKNEPALGAYDILNEPVLGEAPLAVLKKLYAGIIKAIRKNDPRTTILLEGHQWAQKIDVLKDLLGEHVAISIHCYEPYTFTFYFDRGARYPGKIDRIIWNKDHLRALLETYARFSNQHGVGIHVGEFGINNRHNQFGEVDWLDDMLALFQEYGFAWSYWTYKTLSPPIYPSGILEYQDHNLSVRREGPLFGWETYPSMWKTHRKLIRHGWNTKNFTENRALLDILKTHF